MSIYENEIYLKNIKEVADLDIDWKQLKNSNFMITGATGLIGKFLVDTILYLDETKKLNCHIIAIGRNKEKAKSRFSKYFDSKNFEFVELDINDKIEYSGKVDYILHAASSTHPLQYSNYPITTITTNVIALNNLLKFGYEKKIKRFIFASSVEIYGQNKGDVDYFDEKYLGYIDCNTLRAGYPESKRVGEALCQAYIKEKEMNIVIPRLSRTFGPTLLDSDTKALSQFIRNGVNKENIVLKSEGNQLFSYTYVTDAVKGILYTLFYGENGEAYNVSDPKFDITLRDLAKNIASIVGTEVIFDLPSEEERKGYSTATKAIMDGSKIKELGFSVDSDFKTRLEETIEVLRSI